MLTYLFYTLVWSTEQYIHLWNSKFARR